MIRARASRPIKKGHIVCEQDIKSIEEVLLLDRENDFGHFTMLLVKDTWFVQFDFRYHGGEAGKRVHAAREFLDAAEGNLSAGRIRPFAEALFRTAELLTEAELTLLHDTKALKTRNNGTLQGTVWSLGQAWTRATSISSYIQETRKAPRAR